MCDGTKSLFAFDVVLTAYLIFNFISEENVEDIKKIEHIRNWNVGRNINGNRLEGHVISP